MNTESNMTARQRRLDENPRQCWRTPSNFYAAIHAEFAPQIDVAADAENHKCDVFLARGDDALTHPWFYDGILTAWCNPGYSDMMSWCVMASKETERVRGSTALVLGPLSCAPWLTDFCWRHASQIMDIYPRIQFDPPPGIKRSSNARDNVLIVFRHDRFCEHATRFPLVWRRAR